MGGLHGRMANRIGKIVGKKCRGHFDHLLVSSLDRTVSGPQMDHIAMAVGKNLNLNVPGVCESFLQVDSIVAERHFGLRSAQLR